MESQDEKMTTLLTSVRTIAVVGLSADEDKASNGVARYLQGKGYRIIPVNPSYDEVLGEKSYRSLADIPEKVDLVDIFMRSERVVPFVQDAIRLKPKAVWLQLGIRNEEARRLVEASGITFVEDLCVKQEHARLVKG